MRDEILRFCTALRYHPSSFDNCQPALAVRPISSALCFAWPIHDIGSQQVLCAAQNLRAFVHEAAAAVRVEQQPASTRGHLDEHLLRCLVEDSRLRTGRALMSEIEENWREKATQDGMQGHKNHPHNLSVDAVAGLTPPMSGMLSDAAPAGCASAPAVLR